MFHKGEWFFFNVIFECIICFRVKNGFPLAFRIGKFSRNVTVLTSFQNFLGLITSFPENCTVYQKSLYVQITDFSIKFSMTSNQWKEGKQKCL